MKLIDRDPKQARKHFDEGTIDELAQSIKENGLAAPILLRPSEDRYIIVHGKRRYRAAQKLGWETIPALVKDICEEEAVWLSLIENIQREDFSPVEEAEAYQEALNKGITQTELGKRIGKSQSYIAQKLRLLKLPEPIRFYLAQNKLTEGHARQLLRFKKIISDLYGADIDYDMPKECSLESIYEYLITSSWIEDIKKFKPYGVILPKDNNHVLTPNISSSPMMKKDYYIEWLIEGTALNNLEAD